MNLKFKQARGETRHYVAHSSLHIRINAKDMFSSIQHCYIFIDHLFEEKTKTVRHIKFVKSLSLSLFLIPFCVKRWFGF